MSGDESTNPSEFPPPAAFRMETVEAPEGVALLVLAGEIDLATSGGFRDHVESALDRGVRGLVVDLADVTFIDSTMLRELLRAHHDLAGAAGRLVLAAVGTPVARLLELTGTDGVFTIVPDRPGAVALVVGA
jgi:anti-anti-sigma factor